MISPVSMPAARSIVIIASCQLQKTRVGTPRYSLSFRSNSKTQGPLFVTCPAASAARNAGSKFSTGGKVGRTIFKGCSKNGGPPKSAMLSRIGSVEIQSRWLKVGIIQYDATLPHDDRIIHCLT